VEEPAGRPLAQRAALWLLSQRADFDTVAAAGAAALVASCLGTAAHTVLRAPLPKGFDPSDASARAELARAQRRAALAGLRALAAASAGSLALAAAVVGAVRACGVSSTAELRRSVSAFVRGADGDR